MPGRVTDALTAATHLMVDSLLIMQLSSLIERETGVLPADEDLQVENLSVSSIAALMQDIGGTSSVADGRR